MGESASTKPGSRASNRRRFYQRHPVISIVVIALLIPLIAGGYFAWSWNNKLGNVEKIDTSALPNRPDPDDGKSVNILLLGSDKGEPQKGQSKNTSISEDAKAAEWPTGKYRSDTMMVIHVTPERDKAYVISIPRDSFVPIHDSSGESNHSEKINAAFSAHGPLGAISTVENLTGLRMDHLAIIDWEGFKDLSEAVGGVPVTIPKTFYDPKQKVTWEAGDQVLKGDKALKYVRTRYGLVRGDFDRINRQQNFIRSLMAKMLSAGVMANPVKLNNTLEAVTRNLTVDEGWDAGALRSFALSLRGLRTNDVVFLTAPVLDTPTDPTYGSIVRLDENKMAELFEALSQDNMGAYIKANKDMTLPDNVS